MNTGNSVRDTDPRWAANQDPVLSDQVRDIQEIIDKLTAVTLELNRPGNGGH